MVAPVETTVTAVVAVVPMQVPVAPDGSRMVGIRPMVNSKVDV